MAITIEQILKKEAKEAIEELKKRPTPQPDEKKSADEFSVSGHKVMHEEYRPKKEVKNNKGTKMQEVVRIAVPLQKKIVKMAAAFLFGIPVKYSSDPKNSQQQNVAGAIARIVKKCKLNSFDRKTARELFAFKEVAEYWYSIEKPNDDYGFNSKYKLRVARFSPKNGDKLFPRFDEHGDMIAFSREYVIKEELLDVTYFETYTDSAVIKWKQVDADWQEVAKTPHNIGKIPIVYGYQEETEWEDVQAMIERLETLLSNFGDTNDYHGSPKILVKGKIVGFADRGESGAIIEVDGEKGDAKYLSWDHAPESVKLEIETLLRLIHSCTQTPELAFDTVKGLGALSGVALKLMFMDAHLKVIEKREIFDEYLERRINIIKAYIGKMSTALKSAADELEIEPEITPYMIDDEKSTIENLMTATGNKPILSQKSAVGMSGLILDAEAEYKQIQKEESEARQVSLFEPSTI